MFTEGQDYTRDEIHHALGGSKQSYLPDVGGRVVCACLDPKLNPDAPRIIIPGTGPTIEKTADLLFGQKGPIPVFMKQGSNAWRYVGDFEVDPRRFSPADVEEQKRRSGLADITRVIWMRPRVPLHPASSLGDVLASARRFAAAQIPPALTARIFRQNRAWVCTPDAAFAPATWAMHRDVVFGDYAAVLQSKYKDIRISDAEAIDALAKLGLAFGNDDATCARLVTWASTIESGILDNVDRTSLRVAHLPGAPSTVKADPARVAPPPTGATTTYALLANAERYDVEAASATLPEDTWLLPEGDVRVGDRLVFWRTQGKDGHRGVVAFGEVTGEAELREKEGAGLAYWKVPPPVGPQRRLQLRYVQAPNLPLWLDEDSTGTLASLSVSRGQGTKLYRVTPEQMDALVRLAGGWDNAGLARPAPPPVRLVATAAEVAEAVASFNDAAASHPDRAWGLLRSTSLWVYDSATGRFGPNKFVAWCPITFELYEQGKREQNLGGVAFDGNVAKLAIEKAVGRPYVARPKGHAALLEWAKRLAGEGVLDGVDTGKWAMLPLGAWPDEVEEQRFEQEVADAADGATSRRRGQGYSTDPAFRSAVELRAMEVVETHLRGLGLAPKNTSATQPYDFECEGASHHRFVEVKGTTGDGGEVFLTANEVEHARAQPSLCALVIVHGIEVERSSNGRWVATGGTLRDISPWSPDFGTLRPLAYRYAIPE